MTTTSTDTAEHDTDMTTATPYKVLPEDKPAEEPKQEPTSDIAEKAAGGPGLDCESYPAWPGGAITFNRYQVRTLQPGQGPVAL